MIRENQTICSNMDINELLSKEIIISTKSIERYREIMNLFRSENECSDYFIRIYSGFYRLRRNDLFRNKYFELLDSLRDKEVEYEEIVRAIYDFSGRVEASFSSKLLATVNDRKPIWDVYVLKNLNVHIPKHYRGERKLNAYLSAYQEIEKWYEISMLSPEGNRMVEFFNERFPEYKNSISNEKKVDFVLWSIR